MSDENKRRYYYRTKAFLSADFHEDVTVCKDGNFERIQIKHVQGTRIQSEVHVNLKMDNLKLVEPFENKFRWNTLSEAVTEKIVVSAAIDKATDLLAASPSTQSPASPIQIERPPGHNIIAMLQCFMSKARFQKTFGQVIADSRELYYEALADGDAAEAKKIKRELNFDLLRMIVELVAGFPAHLVTKPFERFFKGED